MKYFTLHRTLAVLNLLVLLILLGDNFLLPPTPVLEKYDFRSSSETRSARYAPRFSHFIHTVSGDQFQIPVNWEKRNMGLNAGDSFFVDISKLLRRPIRIYYTLHENSYKIDMGILNNGYWGMIMVFYILFISLIQLLPWRIISGENLNERLIFSGSSVLVVLLFFHFYQ